MAGNSNWVFYRSVFLLAIEESIFSPRDEWEELALQIVKDIEYTFYAFWHKDIKAAFANIEMVSASIESLRKEIEQLEALHKYIAQFKEFFSRANVETIQNARKQLEVAKEEQQAAKIL